MNLRLYLTITDDDTDEPVVRIANGSVASARTVAEILRTAADQIDPPMTLIQDDTKYE